MDKVVKLQQDKLVVKPLGWFKPYPNNPRLFEDHVQKLAGIIKRFGFRVPILAKPDGEIIAGHYRLRAAQVAGLRDVTAIIVTGLTENEIRAFRIADNRVAENSDWDGEALIEELKALMPKNGDFEVLSGLTAFDPDELRSFLEPEPGTEESEEEHEFESNLDSGEDDADILSSGAESFRDESPIAAFKDDVQFDQIGDMGLPPIRRDRLILQPPLDLHCYNKDVAAGVDWKKTTLCFYTADRQFERLWLQTANIFTRFRNLGLKSMVTPDWSTFFGWPKALRAYNIYRSRFIGRYAQEAGLNIIVNVSGSDGDIDYMFDGLPKGCPMATELQARYTPDEKTRMTALLEAVLTWKPCYLLVYAPQDRLELFPVLRQKNVPIHFVTPRMIKRRQEAQNA